MRFNLGGSNLVQIKKTMLEEFSQRARFRLDQYSKICHLLAWHHTKPSSAPKG